MKNTIFTILFAVISISSFSQVDFKDGVYTKVISVDGKSAKDLYQKSKEWISLTYNSAQNVIQLDTEEKIIVKGKFNLDTQMYGYSYSFLIDHTLTIAFKDGRYKVDLSTGKFEHSLYPAMSFETPSYYITKKEQNEYLDEMIITESIKPVKPKMLEQVKSKYGDQLYAQYEIDFKKFHQLIESTVLSLDQYVRKTTSEDEW